MHIVDVLEMLCDWKAATLRHDDGDIMRSIEINAKRFNMPPMLVAIFKNTAQEFFGALPNDNDEDLVPANRCGDCAEFDTCRDQGDRNQATCDFEPSRFTPKNRGRS